LGTKHLPIGGYLRNVQFINSFHFSGKYSTKYIIHFEQHFIHFIDLLQIQRWLFFKDGNNCANLSVIQNQFPNKADLEEQIVNCKTFFWTARHDDNIEVRPKIYIRFCVNYLKDGATCNGYCGRLHLCPVNLMSGKFCYSPCKKGYSLNKADAHNNRVIRAALPHGISYSNQGRMSELLRSSFPRLCKKFTDEGQCPKEYCGYLHLCMNYLKGICQGQCAFAQKIGLDKSIVHNYLSKHNRNVLLNFEFKDGGALDKEELYRNILLSKHEGDESGDVDDSDGAASISSVDLQTTQKGHYM